MQPLAADASDATIGGAAVPPVPATPDGDGALAALCLVARLHQVGAEPAALRHHLGLAPSQPVGVDDVLLAARHLGLKARRCRSTTDRLPRVPLPALACMADGRLVVLAQCDAQRVLVLDSGGLGAKANARPLIEPLATFSASWSGELILIASRASLAGELARFDFSWFIPSLVKHRGLLGEVLLVSLFLQLFALVTPLFFQVVMDKVLVHRGVATLDVLVVGLVAVVLFESVLSGLRSYVFTHTTSRIDVELGSRLYRHLLALPLAYFQARRVGDSVARVRELEHIRSFLTGNALTLVLDVLFSAVFIAVMLFYSVPLTMIVLASVPVYLLLSLAVVPVLRHRLDEKFARGAENQALLVESITGVQTVKAGALEPQLSNRWDQQLAAYVVERSADVTTENAGEGTDTVMSSVTRTLGSNLENLALTGTTAINGTGNTLANVLTGNSAANTLNGLAGNDTYDGGAGNDALTDDSTTSNDVYRWGIGYGVDAVSDAGGTDRVELGAGITAGQVVFTRVGNNLELTVSGNSADKLVVSNWYTATANRIEDFRLSDGSSVPAGQIPASLAFQRETFSRGGREGDRLQADGDVAAPQQPGAGLLGRVPLPAQWWMLSQKGATDVLPIEWEEAPPSAVAPALSAAPASLAQQAQLLASMMAAFDADGDAGAGERQTIQPVHRPDLMYASPAVM